MAGSTGRALAGSLRSRYLEELSVDDVVRLRAAVMWVDGERRPPVDGWVAVPQWTDGQLAALAEGGFQVPLPTHVTRGGWNG